MATDRVKVFISWSGSSSREIANVLARSLPLVLNNVKPWISDSVIEGGGRWWDAISDGLREASYGIICLTPENLHSAWLMAEAGALAFKRSDMEVCPYLIGVNANDLVNTPLSIFQAVPASKESTYRLISKLAKLSGDDLEIVKERFNAHWKPIAEMIEKHQGGNTSAFSIFRKGLELHSAIQKLSGRQTILDNQYLHRIINDDIDDFAKRLNHAAQAGSQFKLVHSLYPTALARLLKRTGALVKAVALVDKEERFWRSTQADDILAHTTENSTRVFVFQDKNHLKENIPILAKHAQRYQVRALSYDFLARQFPRYTYDYSIIGDPNFRVLALYDDTTEPKSIQFTIDRDTVSRHEDELTKIISASKQMPRDIGEKGEEEFIHKVFDEGFTQYQEKKIEMSAYIKIHDYDEHEEQHAYFVDMMNRMLDICNSSRPEGKRIRVLELGAGTGIFTKRLITLRNVEIVPIEIDWACYKALEHKRDLLLQQLRDFEAELHPKNEDSRTFDPPGKFGLVVSSFADHHIKPYDKKKYFENVRRNLENDGVFIVGDEFLPSYDNNVEARRRALEKYHGHIIDEAKRQGHVVLAELEKAALDSGLQEIGDFKLSCDEYERLVTDAGFKISRKDKIGPTNLENVGGVYVYTMRLL